MKKTAQVQTKGFTLVELLVVIAIIAVLAAVVVLIINPLELTRRGRDAARLSDLSNLQSAIGVAVQEATASGVVAVLCATSQSYPCGGADGNGQSHTANNRTSNGTGWVKVDLSTQKSVSLATLPVDPVNNTALHYTYCADADTWEIDVVLESDQQKGKMLTDGSDDDARYEIGSNLALIKTAGGSCTY